MLLTLFLFVVALVGGGGVIGVMTNKQTNNIKQTNKQHKHTNTEPKTKRSEQANTNKHASKQDSKQKHTNKQASKHEAQP